MKEKNLIQKHPIWFIAILIFGVILFLQIFFGQTLPDVRSANDSEISELFKNKEPICQEKYFSSMEGKYVMNITCISILASVENDYFICAEKLMGSYDNGMIDQGKTALCIFNMAKINNDSSLCDKIALYDPNPYNSPISKVYECNEYFKNN